VVPGRPADYRTAHPAHPVLAIEMAESSLNFDREQKGELAYCQPTWLGFRP